MSFNLHRYVLAAPPIKDKQIVLDKQGLPEYAQSPIELPSDVVNNLQGHYAFPKQVPGSDVLAPEYIRGLVTDNNKQQLLNLARPLSMSDIYVAAQGEKPYNLRGIPQSTAAYGFYFLINNIRNFIMEHVRKGKAEKLVVVDAVIDKLLQYIFEELANERNIATQYNPQFASMISNFRPETLDSWLASENNNHDEIITAINGIRESFIRGYAYEVNEAWDAVNQLAAKLNVPMSKVLFVQLVMNKGYKPKGGDDSVGYTHKEYALNFAPELVIEKGQNPKAVEKARRKQGEKIAKEFIVLIDEIMKKKRFLSKSDISGAQQLCYLKEAINNPTEPSSEKIRRLVPTLEKYGVLEQIAERFNPITIDEILTAAGFDPMQYAPEDPLELAGMSQEEYNNYYEESISNPEASVKNYFVGANGEPYNRQRLMNIVETAIEDGEYVTGPYVDSKLSKFFASEWRGKIRPAIGSPDHFLRAIIQEIFGQDVNLFKQFLTESGKSVGWVSNLGNIKKKSEIEPDYVFGSDFGLDLESDFEFRVVDEFRNNFNIEVAPFHTEVNAPTDCPTNTNGYELDFMFPADVLVGWKNENNINIPVLQTQIIFTGEAFGWDSELPITPDEFDKKLQKRNTNTDIEPQISSPDGNMMVKMFDDGDNRQVMMIKDGEEMPANYGHFYALKSEWKRMYETFLARAVGGQAIFLLNDRNPGVEPLNTQIAKQLGTHNIIWNNGVKSSNAYKMVARYIQNCEQLGIPIDPSVEQVVPIDEDGFRNVRRFTPDQVYVRCAMAKYRMQYGFIPIYKAASNDDSKFNTKDIVNYLSVYTEIQNALIQEQRNYLNVKTQEEQILILQKISAYQEQLQRMAGEDNKIGRLLEAYSKLESGGYGNDDQETFAYQNDYMTRVAQLQELLVQVDNGMISGAELKINVDNIIPEFNLYGNKDFNTFSGFRWAAVAAIRRISAKWYSSTRKFHL